MDDHKKYHDIGQAFMTQLKLMTYPVAGATPTYWRTGSDGH